MSAVKKSVAIVDDDEVLLEATSGFLEAMGYEPLPFPSGEAFLNFDQKEGLTLLLSDINMPGMSGFELLDIVRKKHPEMRIVMMTALKDENIIRKALAGGAQALLQKPILADDLVKCIEG
ncbi:MULTISPECIES: response regulator [Rhizobium]|uniref:Response regulator receiver domain-containing protein n=1 Tax=Rhizobium lusitanum TaxID=293958 RepID=A0A1C3WC86_9HYPH|nr:response regulator [Rhizobium lusitanum]SCB37496.1 Response regulator receiver domain-containing protein [Rhizobium lusitanum]